MALKPTIFKLNITLSDMERERYDTIDLTIAQHPSETTERMMARILAYCINADEGIKFTKGLSEVDEPDIWIKTLDDQISLWIDVGEPEFERVKKASHRASTIKIYSFNSKSATWWEQSKAKFSQINALFYQFDFKEIQTLATLVQRTMALSVMITGDSAYITLDDKQCEVTWAELR